MDSKEVSVQMGEQAMGYKMRVENELTQLRRRLADAWWHEAPLPVIEGIEGEIQKRVLWLESSSEG